MFSKLRKQYSATWEILSRFWQIYGGYKSWLSSPYLHLAVILGGVTWWRWDSTINGDWYDLVLSIIPDMLGFTLGGYAILLAFGNDRFKKEILVGDPRPGEPSPYMVMSAVFMNFLMMMVLSLLYSLIAKAFSLSCGFGALIGWVLFIYSATLALAAVFWVFRLSDWFNKYNQVSRGDDN